MQLKEKSSTETVRIGQKMAEENSRLKNVNLHLAVAIRHAEGTPKHKGRWRFNQRITQCYQDAKKINFDYCDEEIKELYYQLVDRGNDILYAHK